MAYNSRKSGELLWWLNNDSLDSYRYRIITKITEYDGQYNLTKDSMSSKKARKIFWWVNCNAINS